MLLLLFIGAGVAGPPPVRPGRHATSRRGMLVLTEPDDVFAMLLLDIL